MNNIFLWSLFSLLISIQSKRIFIEVVYYPDDKMTGITQGNTIHHGPSQWGYRSTVGFPGTISDSLFITIQNNSGNGRISLNARISIGSSVFSTNDRELWIIDDSLYYVSPIAFHDQPPPFEHNGKPILGLGNDNGLPSEVQIFQFNIPIQPYCSSLISDGTEAAIVYSSLTHPYVMNVFYEYTFPLDNSISTVYIDSITYLTQAPNGELYEGDKLITSLNSYSLDVINFKVVTYGDMIVHYKLISKGVATPPCDLTLRVCYEGCKRCSNNLPNVNNHQCLQCEVGYKGTIQFNGMLSCTRECFNEWFNDQSGVIQCVDDCNMEYPLLIPDTGECVKQCPHGTVLYEKKCLHACPPLTFLYNSKCHNDCYPNPPQTHHQASYIDKTLTDCLQTFHDNILDYRDLYKPLIGIYFILEVFDYRSDFNIFKNVSSIDLIYIETLLGPSSKPLIVAKYDILLENSLNNQVEYSVFDSQGAFIDLSFLMNQLINITYPLKAPSLLYFAMAEGIMNKTRVDILDHKGSFYNDLCFPFSYNNSDVILKDRRDYFFPSLPFCERDCYYLSTDYKKHTIRCECLLKPNVSPLPKYPLHSYAFPTLLNKTNKEIGRCYHLIASTEVINSFAFRFMCISLFFQLILFIVYFKSELKAIYPAFQLERAALRKITKKHRNTKKTSGETRYLLKSNNETLTSFIDIVNNYQYMKPYLKGKRALFYNYSFYLSVRIDNRTMWEMLKAHLFQKILILRIFIFISPFELASLKMSHLLLINDIYLCLNAVLIGDNIISKKYFEGEFYWLSLFKNAIITFIASQLVSFFMNKLITFYHILEELTLNSFRERNYLRQCRRLLNKMRLRISLYYVMSFVIAISCWYYAVVFGYIYKKSTGALIRGYSFTLYISLTFTVVLSLISSSLRYYSLINHSKVLYSVSALIQSKL